MAKTPPPSTAAPVTDQGITFNGSVPPLTPPSSTVNSISTTLSTFRALFARRSDFRYSFSVIVFETIWNLVFIVATVITLLCTLNEKPIVPLRVWLSIRSLQRTVHVMFVLLEYYMKNRRVVSVNTSNSISIGIRVVRRLKNLSTEYFESWWCHGFFWMLTAHETLLSDSPRLFWLTRAVLAPDLLFDIFEQRCASPAKINILPKYELEVSNDEKQHDGRSSRMVPMGTNAPDFSTVRVLQSQDSRCCICFCEYEDGAKLSLLPCKHHFHGVCVATWLKIKAMCPLCKKVIY